MLALIHVDIFVTDLRRSIAFYTEFLGAQVVDTGQTEGDIPNYYSSGKSTKCSMAILKFSMIGATIELMQLESSTVASSPMKGSISFHVNNLEDFRNLLEQKGARIDSEVFHVTLESGVQSRLFFLLDPDGHRLEFIESSRVNG